MLASCFHLEFIILEVLGKQTNPDKNLNKVRPGNLMTCMKEICYSSTYQQIRVRSRETITAAAKYDGPTGFFGQSSASDADLPSHPYVQS